mmetsp:Transcript_39966/g.61150  ORF Transcript_39966/g.61150 Transcript_39966/m.61150 type:complete len:100 (-) Transcript_39966:1090-1389(-)
MVFELLIPIVTFDLLESFEDQVQWVYGVFGATEDENEDEPEVPDNFQTVGFDKWEPIPNLGTLGVVFIIYVFKVFAFGISYLLKPLVHRAGPIAEKLRK